MSERFLDLVQEAGRIVENAHPFLDENTSNPPLVDDNGTELLYRVGEIQYFNSENHLYTQILRILNVSEQYTEQCSEQYEDISIFFTSFDDDYSKRFKNKEERLGFAKQTNKSIINALSEQKRPLTHLRLQEVSIAIKKEEGVLSPSSFPSFSSLSDLHNFIFSSVWKMLAFEYMKTKGILFTDQNIIKTVKKMKKETLIFALHFKEKEITASRIFISDI